jgi:hypothetical protein
VLVLLSFFFYPLGLIIASHYKEKLGLDDARVTFTSKIEHKPIVAAVAEKMDYFGQRYFLPRRDRRGNRVVGE